MNRKLCVIQGFLTDAHKEQIAEAALSAGLVPSFYAELSEAKEAIGEAEVVYCSSADIAQHAASARWVASSWAGVAPFLKEGVLPEGCILTKGAGTYGIAISEYVVAMTINLLKRFPEYAVSLQKREWKGGLHIRSIYGSRVTVVGTGDIGQNIAVRMKALCAGAVTGVNYSGRNPENLFDRVVDFTRIDEVLPETDILLLAAPDTEETRGMISRERIALLPAHAVLVNVGRGSILDQDALMEALNEERLMGAALDVMEPEPLPKDHPLWSTKRCILTPHISGFMTLDFTADQAVRLFCDNLVRYGKGEPLTHLVDFEKGY